MLSERPDPRRMSPSERQSMSSAESDTDQLVSHDSRSSTAQGAPRLGFWVTLCLALAALIVPSLPIEVGFAFWRNINPDKVAAYRANAAMPYIKTGIILILQTTAFFLAARIASKSTRKYLGLIWPQRRHLLLGATCLVGFLILFQGPTLFVLFHGGNSVAVAKFAFLPLVDAYRSAMNSGVLALFLLSLVAIGPIGEEIAYRGFLFRGWSESPLGALGTIILTTLVWTAFHLANPSPQLFAIFCLGLLLGWLRWRSQSVVLPIMVHASINIVAMMEAAVVISREAPA
jgi:membrane protease YdiL (CAAX protease family)